MPPESRENTRGENEPGKCEHPHDAHFPKFAKEPGGVGVLHLRRLQRRSTSHREQPREAQAQEHEAISGPVFVVVETAEVFGVPSRRGAGYIH